MLCFDPVSFKRVAIDVYKISAKLRSVLDTLRLARPDDDEFNLSTFVSQTFSFFIRILKLCSSVFFI